MHKEMRHKILRGSDLFAAGLQMVIPGCESRTLPKSVTRADETGQGVLHFFSFYYSDFVFSRSVPDVLEISGLCPIQVARPFQIEPDVSGTFRAQLHTSFTHSLS